MKARFKYGFTLAAIIMGTLGSSLCAAEQSPIAVVAVDVSLNEQQRRAAHYAATQIVDAASDSGQRVALVTFSDYVESVVPAQQVSQSTRTDIDQIFSTMPDPSGIGNIAVGLERALSEIDTKQSYLLFFASLNAFKPFEVSESDQFQWLSRILLPEASETLSGMTLATPASPDNLNPVLGDALHSIAEFNLMPIESDISGYVLSRMGKFSSSTILALAPTDDSPAAGDSLITRQPVAVEPAPVEPTAVEPTAIEPPPAISAEQSSDEMTDEMTDENVTRFPASTDDWLDAPVFMWIGALLVLIGAMVLLAMLVRLLRQRSGRSSAASSTMQSKPPEFPDETDHYLPLDISSSRRFSQAATGIAKAAPAVSRQVNEAPPGVDHEAVTVVQPVHEEDEPTIIKPPPTG